MKGGTIHFSGAAASTSVRRLLARGLSRWEAPRDGGQPATCQPASQSQQAGQSHAGASYSLISSGTAAPFHSADTQASPAVRGWHTGHEPHKGGPQGPSRRQPSGIHSGRNGIMNTQLPSKTSNHSLYLPYLRLDFHGEKTETSARDYYRFYLTDKENKAKEISVTGNRV